VASGAILTIGNEVLCGDVPNTNGAWLARRMESLGISVRLVAALPDEIDAVAIFVREQAGGHDVVVVTGGLGGTPDDLTRPAIAAAFGVEQAENGAVASELRARFAGDPDYAARWAELPVGSRVLGNPLGGAPGFVIENVYVLPGLPREMEAMFDTVAEELRRGRPIESWRRTYLTSESRIAGVLEEICVLHPGVLVGSYPSFHAHGQEVEVVVKSSDPAALAAAVVWIERALDRATR
jgi:molybdenum cofactor synthesis domain-containing protein